MPMSDIEEIKQRLDIIDVVREYIQMKQAGANWKALCPFHNEKTPSFMVSGEKQIWHCFGCDEGGDVFSFVQKIEGIDFPEALRILADKAGVKLKKINSKLKNEKTRLLDICAAAANFFHRVLLETAPGKEVAGKYLRERKVNSEAIENFKLGYAPDSWDLLSRALAKKGFQEKAIFLAGLTVKKNKGVGYYDRFRGRLIFPIADVYGNIIGFTGRILSEKQEGTGKYVNTPATAIYDKSKIIYGLHLAKEAVKEEDLAVLVEGNMDVVASHQAGIKNVAAISGTALTIEQIRLFKRYTKNIALAFDADPAGEGACERSIDLALQEEMNVRIIEIPAGKDPDDCIKKEPRGPRLWQEAIYNSKSIMEYYFDKTFTKYNGENLEDKRAAGDILLSNIAKLKNKIEQAHWLQRLSERLKVPESVLWESLPKLKKTKKETAEKTTAMPKIITPEEHLPRQLLAAILKFPRFLELALREIIPPMFNHPQSVDIYKQLVSYYNKYNSLGLKISDFIEKLPPELGAEAKKLLLLADKDFPEELTDSDFQILRQRVSRLFKAKKRKEFIQKIKQAEKEKNQEQLSKIMRDFQIFSEE